MTDSSTTRRKKKRLNWKKIFTSFIIIIIVICLSGGCFSPGQYTKKPKTFLHSDFFLAKQAKFMMLMEN